MRSIFLLISFIFGISSIVFSQGTLVEDTIILHLDFDDIDNLLLQNGLPLGLLPTNYEVDVHRVVYNTPDVDGSPTTASGLVCLPTGDTCAMPIMAYLHGTKVKKDDTFYYLNGEWSVGVLSATHGYAMVLPDYIGLGMSPGIHPYQHAQSEATASIDIMRACRIICENQSLELNNQLFIMGYSQGGHSVMATHRMIQEELAGEFAVTASAPGSGPYDMAGSQLDMVSSFEPYAQPGYLPYLIQSYQHVYGNLYDSIQQIYVPPYDQTLPPLLDGNYYMGELNSAMPSVPRLIFQQEYQDAFFSDTLHPAFIALKDNDVYQWVPDSPVLFNYCRSDEEVSYLNTLIASQHMIDAGAQHVEVIERDSIIGHFDCASPSILFSKLWFDTKADFCSSGSLGIIASNRELPISFYPNPNSSGVLNFQNARDLEVSFLDLNGKQIGQTSIVGSDGIMDISSYKPGLYLLEIIDRERRIVKPMIVQ
ncbi:T9SS type A sorting domain-containing protein, partial [Flavobacteriales bacterium]|nr:T9SS type A sorting domain-containing protein [Flavobacteriales bacterium]